MLEERTVAGCEEHAANSFRETGKCKDGFFLVGMTPSRAPFFNVSGR